MDSARSSRRRRSRLASGLVAILVASAAHAGEDTPGPRASEPSPAEIDFFEKSVRPILVQRCQGCHGPSKQKGGLRLDSRQGVLAGGTTGPAVVPGRPEKSPLIDAVNYGELFQMPPKSKLSDEEIRVLTAWVERGAAWGFEPGANKESASARGKSGGGLVDLETPGEFARRAKFWCFQPIRAAAPPSLSDDANWSRNPIDGFLLAAMRQHGLSPAPEADRRTLIRRLSFDLTGLPPSPEEVAEFLADPSPDAYERLVDRLLNRPHYGERWGRHWLDLARFAETAGHEFDYETLHSFRYRDYVIRAFNADLPYDRFVVEQVAGDLLTSPRRHPTEGFNESVLGTGFFFLGEGTHSPVDVREDQVRRVDNQIEVLARTFLGLTVSCARCHDHKFDPIRSDDYYALAGYMVSSRHQQAFLDPPARIGGPAERLRNLKSAIRGILNEAMPSLSEESSATVRRAVEPARKAPSPLIGQPFEPFDRDSFAPWQPAGDAFGQGPSAAGDFRLSVRPTDAWLTPVRPGAAHSGLVSERLQGVLRSPTFTLNQRWIHYLAAGQGGRINLVVDGFEKIRDPIYGRLTVAVGSGDQRRWISQDVGMWLGHRAYIELSDGGTADYNGGQTRMAPGRGFVVVDEIRMSDGPAPRLEDAPDPTPLRLDALISTLRSKNPSLAARLGSLLDEYRSIEAAIPEPTFGLAIADGTGEDARKLIRGNHRTPGDVVPRRFLEVLGGAAEGSAGAGSGRLELARTMVDPRSNPLVPRVMVNRLWKHHFAEGLVKTVDDFGAMGQPPSHPELLDWLSAEFVARGWSIKAMHRLIVTSSAYRMSSRARPGSDAVDPSNVYLHRMNPRRLEGEAIRDLLLAVSGRLDAAMFGPGVPPYLSPFMDGRGRPQHSGPLDGDGRRSIYLNVRRNFLNPMFLSFDTPVPFSTMGRRNVSNVPGQALTLLNDPLVIHLAGLWAGRLLAEGPPSDGERIGRLFEAAYGRPPSEAEREQCLAFLRERGRGAGDARRAAWADLCHAIMNVKSFIFIE
ncbi:MAG: PSD1 and planctomycete cytochrome C domain-containing protein [Isosphaeraceae bacterium]